MEKYSAKFYDVSEIVYTSKKGFCNKDEIINVNTNKNLLVDYIKINKIYTGDILFLGGEDRLDNSFRIVGVDYELLEGYDPAYIFCLGKRNENFLNEIKEKISYKNVLKKLYEDSYFNDIFYGNNDDLDILYKKVVSFYIEKGIY